jgi:hypothetical protein
VMSMTSESPCVEKLNSPLWTATRSR